MIKPIDKAMNTIVCYEAPIVDALAEIFFVVGGLMTVYGIYQVSTGKQMEGTALAASGVMALLTTPYTKEISQTVSKSCNV